MAVKNADTWGESHIGYKREDNEDRFLIKELRKIIILAVADGIAGCAGGEVAAQTIIDVFQEYEFSKENLEKDLSMTLLKAEKQIHKKVKNNSGLEGMGTTATIAVSYKNKVFWTHVGDSRMYLFHDKKIKQITTDHTFIQDLIDDSTLTLDQAKKHPLRNMLDQCVGCDEMDPDSGMFKIKKNDRLLLCSDGLTKHLSDLQIESILQRESIQEAGQKLIKAALKMGGTDNVTVIVKEFKK